MAATTQIVAPFRIETFQPEYLRCDTHFQDIIQRLHTRVDLCDVKLIAGNSPYWIAAHRLILIACSDYFSDLLIEPISDAQPREVILNVDGEALGKLINYFYTGALELEGKTIEVILTTANHLRLQKIVDACCDFIQRNLQPENCLAVAFFAEKLHLQELLHKTKKFIFSNFTKVSNQAEFLLLTFKQLNEFIASDDVRFLSGEFTFDILMKWIEYEPETRRQHFTELLAQMRLSLLQPAFLMEKVAPLCETMESKDIILNALKPHLVVTSTFIQPANYSMSNSVVKHLLAISTRTSEHDGNLVIASYNLQEKKWTIFNTPIKRRDDFAVALKSYDLIIVGGKPNGSRLNAVTSLNLTTMSSTEMAPLRTARSGHHVAVLNGSIYAIGGTNSGILYLNSVEKWDPKFRTWNAVASMEKSRMFPSVAVFNDNLYVSGGYDTGNCYGEYLASVECYDPIKNVWRTTAPMKVKRSSHCLAVHNGYLYAIGGCNNQNKTPVERYDPCTDTWTTISCSQSIYGRTTCTSFGPDLFVYNNSNIFMIRSKSNCNHLELRCIASDTMDYFQNYNAFSHLVAIAYEFRPPESAIHDRTS